MSFPIELPVLGAYTLTVAAIVLSPGPDTILIVRYSLTSGRRVGLATVAGVQIGILIHTLLAVLGVSLIIASSPVLFKTLAVAGAGYLAWLGLQGFRPHGALRFNADRPAVGPRRAARDAIFCNLLNPKVVVLFLALLPNFVDTGRDDVSLQLVILALVLLILNILWQAPIVLAANQVRRLLKNPKVERTISQGTGAILFGFAGLMLYDHLWVG